eukprot:9963983-Alexandrium_andersonii.AAC.1
MSASLVGSEMCIRDRSGGPFPPGEQRRKLPTAARWLLYGCRRRGRRFCCCLLYTSDAADDM